MPNWSGQSQSICPEGFIILRFKCSIAQSVRNTDITGAPSGYSLKSISLRSPDLGLRQFFFTHSKSSGSRAHGRAYLPEHNRQAAANRRSRPNVRSVLDACARVLRALRWSSRNSAGRASALLSCFVGTERQYLCRCQTVWHSSRRSSYS